MSVMKPSWRSSNLAIPKVKVNVADVVVVPV